ncbi:MAG TPA: hypothetical protein VLE20_01905 [Blastocatellia bacterium]|nr:hypothetical protein [Blastocatellia bacterium]
MGTNTSIACLGTLITLPGLVYRSFDRWKQRNISLLVAMGPLNSLPGDQRPMTLKAGCLGSADDS